LALLLGREGGREGGRGGGGGRGVVLWGWVKRRAGTGKPGVVGRGEKEGGKGGREGGEEGEERNLPLDDPDKGKHGVLHSLAPLKVQIMDQIVLHLV